uniref:Zona pellucida sperm-binding protein 4 n=1 Tax=Gasterosteus aculeatus aculeatus TaxID=481459 RepID=A0AAQ4QFP9_GASAC
MANTNPQTPLQPKQPKQPQQQWQIPNPQTPQQPKQPQQPWQIPNSQTLQQPQQPQQPSYIENHDKLHGVVDTARIPCGPPDITSLDCQAINCCYQGRMCYYSKAVTLQCTKDAQIIIVVSKVATIPFMDLDSIHFNGDEPNCSAVDTTSHFAVYQFPPTGCGTVLKAEPGVLIYENRMFSLYDVSAGPYGMITRDSRYELIVQCKYIGSTVFAVTIEVGPLPAPSSVAAPGPLRVELRLGNGQSVTKGCREEDVAFNSFYADADYPITKVLRDPVYERVSSTPYTTLVFTPSMCVLTATVLSHVLYTERDIAASSKGVFVNNMQTELIT